MRVALQIARAAAGLALLCALAAPAAAATISGLGLSDSSTSAFDDSGGGRSVAQSSASVLASGASGFDVQYAAVAGADTNPSDGTFSQAFSGSFSITFSVTENAGWSWTVAVDVVRNGALTIIHDGTGSASVTLGALTVSHSGAGALSGSLDLAAVGTLSNAGSAASSLDSPFAQSAAASVSGVGTGAAQLVTLTFSFTASATTVDPPGGAVQGDEAALRMGIDSALGEFSADDYPGAFPRALAGDGIFVTASALPEPTAEVLLALGLIGLAWFDRAQRR